MTSSKHNLIVDQEKMEYAYQPLSNLNLKSLLEIIELIPDIDTFIECYCLEIQNLSIEKKVKLYCELLMLGILPFPKTAAHFGVNLQILDQIIPYQTHMYNDIYEDMYNYHDFY